MEFQFDSLQAFFWMKGHGPYVWASYVITLVGIAYLAFSPKQQRKQLFKVLRANKRRQQGESTETPAGEQHREPKTE